MTRTFVCLAAALGMLIFSGCGELPGGGVVAASSPPKPAAPAAGDQNLKPTPASLTPSKLPPIEAAQVVPAGGQPPVEQPVNGQPPIVAPPGTPPIVAPPTGTGTAPGTTPTTPPVAPPAKGADNLFKSQVGDTPPAKTPNGSEAPAGAVEMNLVAPNLLRINPNKLHFDLSYTLTKGQPAATNWYTVVVEQGADPESQAIPPVEVKFEGTALNGRLSGDARLTGKNPNYTFSVFESTSKDDKGRLISNVLKVEDKSGEANGAYRRPAAPGVGGQGRGYGGGLITTPVSVYFATKEKIVFTIQIPKSMQLFNALNNRNPNSQEEFMEKIIKDNRITLPELPPGERYVYDPKAGQLTVEHPAK